MMAWISRWLLGLENTVRVLDARIVFAWGVPAWLVAFLIILAGVYCYRIYKREAEEMNSRYRLLLTVLRFITWIAVILVVLQPRLMLDRLVEPKSNLAILIDTSESMTLVDRNARDEYYLGAVRAARGGIDSPSELSTEDKAWVSETPRAQILQSALQNEEINLLEALGEKYALRFFTFDEKSIEQDPYAEDEQGDRKLALPPAEGKITQLGSALRTVTNQLRGLPLAGVVAFTDGASNKGEAPEMVARVLGEREVPVFPVGVGAPEAVDVEVMDANLPDLIFKDDEIAVRVFFTASGLKDTRLPVTLTLDDKVIGEGTVIAKDGRFQEDFVIRPHKVGDLVFKVEVPQQADEYFVDNNILQKRVRVIDSAIRILIAVDTPSWEYRYLKGFLNSDERIETKVFIRRGDLRRSETDEQYLQQFPTYETLKREVDCLILNNITSDYFSTDQLKQIESYVSDEGGSLIMISSTKGTPGTFIGTPVGDMLPVRLKRIAEDPSLDLADTFTRGYQLRLTREGRYHLITRLNPLEEENLKLWPTLPNQYWYYTGIIRLKPTAVSLVEHATAQNEYGRIPLMALHRYGRGQVLFMGFNSVWRWRYKIGNKYTNRFWGQTIQFMGLPHLLGNLKRVQFETQGRDFIEGEQIPVTVRVQTPEFQPIRDQQVTLVASNKDTGEESRFTFHIEGDKVGVFDGNLSLKKGTWHIVVEGYDQEETLVLDIRPPRYEYEKPAMQKNVLQTVADLSGGTYIDLGEIATLPEKIGKVSKLSRSKADLTLWDTWLSLLLITICTAAEWVLRKRKDMP